MTKKETQLQLLRNSFQEMSLLTTCSLKKSIQAFIHFDLEEAILARNFEKEIDKMYDTIDEACMITIATQQPAASDMRLIVAIVKSAGEMERIADYANNIGKIVQRHLSTLDRQNFSEAAKTLVIISASVLQMLEDCQKAYLSNNAGLASSVIERVALVEVMVGQLHKELTSLAVEKPVLITAILDFQKALQYLERVAFRTSTIAKWIHYMVLGQRYN